MAKRVYAPSSVNERDRSAKNKSNRGIGSRCFLRPVYQLCMSFVTELQRERCRGSQSHGVAHRAAGARPLNVLMVSRSEAWSSAVRAAICDAGADLVTCAAHEAVTRLAGTASHYTHLLVRDHDADGLTGVLADMTTEIARPDTKMLMLGGKIDASARTSRAIRVISAADPRVVQGPLMNSPARLRSDVALAPAELRAALEDGVIEVRYQPIIRVADRKPVGVEALARLVHPTLGLMQPDRFVPQIEAAGLAPQFTALVSARVFADLLGPGLAGTGLRVSVNFPLDVLQSPAALRRLEQQRAAAG